MRLARPQQSRRPGSAQLRAQSGVMLLEALIGILLFTLGILALLGLQGSMVRATSDVKYRSEATYLANQIIGRMWLDRTNLQPSGNRTASTSIAPFRICRMVIRSAPMR